MAKDLFESLGELLEGAEYEPSAVHVAFREDQTKDSIEKYLAAVAAKIPLRYVRQAPAQCIDCFQQPIPGQFRECYDLFTDPGWEGEIFKQFNNYRYHCIYRKPK